MEVKNKRASLVLYGNLLSDIKTRIRQAQVKVTLSANAEMIAMYWDIGRMIYERQQHEGWGTGVIPRLAKDIRNALPKVKGFSERNIGYMIRLAREYGDPAILQQAVAKLPVNKHSVIVQRLVAQILAEYALRDVHKPIGISEYELTRSLPDNLKSSLPSIEEIEAELGGSGNNG
jgi:predicted nuclease of restriction endonuclease-like (RecB) superfamily